MEKIGTARILILLLFFANAVAIYLFKGDIFEYFNPPPLCVIKKEQSKLEVAIDQGSDLSAIATLVEGGEDINREDGRIGIGRTPLMQALQKSRYDIAGYLLAKGVDPNARSPRSGSTALNESAERCDVKSVAWLLKHGANATLGATNGYPLENAVYGGACKAAACKKNCLATAELLVEHGADVNKGGTRTLLQAAAMKCDIDMMRFLIKSGAKTSANNAEFQVSDKYCPAAVAILK